MIPNTVSRSLATRTADFLEGFPPFSYLPREELEALAPNLNLKYFPQHAFIFKEGDEPHGVVYVLQKGRLEFLQRQETEVRIIDVGDEGDLFGVRSLLTGNPYMSSVRAAEDALVYVIPQELFSSILGKYPRVSMFFAAGMAAGMTILREQGGHQAAARKQLSIGPNGNTHLFREEDVIVMQPREKVVFCLPSNTIREAAEIMREYRIGSLIVADAQLHPVGIVTNVDFTRKLGTGEVDAGQDVTHIMSSPVKTIGQGMTTAKVILHMMRHDIRHLIVTEDGTPDSRFVGIITEHDVLLSQGNNPAVLAKRMMRAKNAQTMAEIRDRSEALIHSYLEQEVSISFIADTITEINDALIRRAIELTQVEMTEDDFKTPRQRFCWLALGSEGRGEQLLRTDQDNALIYEDPPPAVAEEVRAYYLELGRRVVNILYQCGFALCPGDIMASNPKWNQSLSGWKAHFSRWIRTPEPRALMHSSIFFDYRPAFGWSKLTDALTRHLYEEMDAKSGFINFFAQNALRNPPPLSFLRNFVVERGGNHKDEFDIKARGMMPLTDAARVLITSHRLPGINNTMRRYRSLAELEPQNAELYEEAAMAYELMVRHRALNGFAHHNSGRFLNISNLNKIERQTLKYAFRTIDDLQSLLRTRFNLNFFRN